MKRLLSWLAATVAGILLGAAAPSAEAQIEIPSGPGYTYRMATRDEIAKEGLKLATQNDGTSILIRGGG